MGAIDRTDVAREISNAALELAAIDGAGNLVVYLFRCSERVRDQRKRLDRIMAKRNSQLPPLSADLGETLITEWDDLIFFTGGGKATLETDGGDRAPVSWSRAAYVYIPSEDSIYSTDPRKLWSAGLEGENQAGIYENPLYSDDVDADAGDELPS